MISRILIHKGRTACGAMAAALLALSGCSTEHEVGPGAENAKLITFTPAVSSAAPGTRAAAGHPIENGGNIPDGKSFGVYAYSRTSSGATAVSYNTELPNNTQVTHNGTAFTYSPVAKWPVQNGAELAFYGYYPWQDQSATPSPLVDPVIEVRPLNSSEMWIYYTTPADPANQIDLMYAYTDFSTGFESVDMEFHHALTRINFKARYEDYTQSLQITSITIKDVLPKGLLTVMDDDSSPTWGNVINGSNTAPIDMTLTEDNGLVRNQTLTSTLSWVSVPGSTTETAGDMLVIPQNVENMVVEVEVTIGSDPETFTFPLAGTPDWEMNQIVTYEITIAGNGMRITPQIRSNWDDNHIEVIQDGQWWMYMDEDEFEFDVNAGTQTLSLETNYNPDPLQDFPVGLFVEAVGNGDEITYDPAIAYPTGSPWLTLTAKTGADGDLDREIEIKTAPNDGMAARRASFTVTAGNLSKVIHVTQLPYVITNAEAVYENGLPLAAGNTNPVLFHLWGTFPASTARVRIRYSNVTQPPSSQPVSGAGTGQAVSHRLSTTANASWSTRQVYCEYFDPHAGPEGEWITINQQPQTGFDVTIATATKVEDKAGGKSTVTVSGYRPPLTIRAVVDGTTTVLSSLRETTNSTPLNETRTHELNIPALPGGVNERDIRIEYDRDGVWTFIEQFTQIATSIAPRFARSNVVWDAANNRLTFATTPEENTTVAPANAQGVFFKWGSLVAVSPVSSSNAFAPSQILFSARGATYSVWEDPTNGIPYLDQANYSMPPFDSNDPDEDDFDGFDDGSGLRLGYNDNTDRGDICRYITAQGWVSGGERWRLPKASEYNELMAELNSVRYPTSGGFSYIGYLTPSTPGYDAAWDNGYWQVPSGRWFGSGATADAATGEQATKVPGTNSVYFPVGGHRYGNNGYASYADYYGYAWSGSSYGAWDASNLGVKEVGATWNHNFRYYAFPVRCIRDE